MAKREERKRESLTDADIERILREHRKKTEREKELAEKRSEWQLKQERRAKEKRIKEEKEKEKAEKNKILAAERLKIVEKRYNDLLEALETDRSIFHLFKNLYRVWWIAIYYWEQDTLINEERPEAKPFLVIYFF